MMFSPIVSSTVFSVLFAPTTGVWAALPANPRSTQILTNPIPIPTPPPSTVSHSNPSSSNPPSTVRSITNNTKPLHFSAPFHTLPPDLSKAVQGMFLDQAWAWVYWIDERQGDFKAKELSAEEQRDAVVGGLGRGILREGGDSSTTKLLETQNRLSLRSRNLKTLRSKLKSKKTTTIKATDSPITNLTSTTYYFDPDIPSPIYTP